MDEKALMKMRAALDACPCEKSCSACGGKLLYSWKHDAFFCPGCDVWTENVCKNPGCEYCAGRPERPSQALKVPGRKTTPKEEFS